MTPTPTTPEEETMQQPYGIYEGTTDHREYADGFDQGRVMGEHDQRHYPATVWNEIRAAQGELRSMGRRTRCYTLGWLRGYREVVR